MGELFEDRGPLRLQALRLRFTESLFFIPALMVLASLLLSQITVAIDKSIADEVLPSYFQTTVESSRAILAAIAGGTITAASVVFSLTLIAVQLAASQFSPRVLQGFLGDRFQQIVMGTVVGTFSFSLFVLREVSSAPGDESAFIPQLSIAVALLLAITALMSVLASIDHTAKGLRVGTVADGIMERTIAVIKDQLVPRQSEEDAPVLVDAPGRIPAPQLGDDDITIQPPQSARTLFAPRTGWVTGLQATRVVEVIPAGSTALISAAIGTYVVEGTPLAHVWPCEENEFNEIVDSLHEIIRIENERSTQQDIGFGFVQFNDMALKALSPGVNDPNTAVEIIVRIGAVVTELFRHRLGPQRYEADSRTVLRPGEAHLEEYVDLAFESIRRYARSDHRVLGALVQTVHSIIQELERVGLDHEQNSARETLWKQIALAGSESEQLATVEDRRRLRAIVEPILAKRPDA
ncbi:MAG: DUF2254 domain-containing protein [Acidimicrobiales bacterium]|nr:DUF2254 domain-containing protein [Acidimicrobiales bacterium]